MLIEAIALVFLLLQISYIDAYLRLEPSKLVNRKYSNVRMIAFSFKELKPLKFLTCISIASVLVSNTCVADQKPSVSYNLERNIENLEKSETREQVVQSLADLYEAAGAKTLLARSKYKYRINDAINMQHEKFGANWDQVLSFEGKELKRRVDPFRTADLSSYLKVAPFIGGLLYLGTLFIQQRIPELFIFAYPAAVFVLVIPAIYVVLTL